MVKNEIGNKYGRLLVLERVGNYTNGVTTWKCICECGVEKIIPISSLRDGRVKSCGCLRKGIKSNYIEGAYKKQYQSMLSNSKRLENKFKISRDNIIDYQTWKEIVNQKCTYCNLEPYDKHQAYGNLHRQNKIEEFAYFNGIDRIDSNKNYIKENIVSCCKSCNQMKTDNTLDEFKQKIKDIYENLFSN